MRKIPTFVAVCFSACAACAAVWPFGTGEDDTNAPPRLHRLLEKANDLIELAEDEGLKGDAEKALDFYRQALDELGRVARENPERAETPEFAPLRNKIASTSAAIDSIRFAQINQNVRTVTVCDTTALQKRYDEERARKRAGAVPAATNAAARAVARAPSAATNAAARAVSPSPAKAHALPADFAGRLKVAYDEVKARDYASADLLLEALQKEQPENLDVLLLRAAAQTGMKSFYAARRTLEAAMRAHPKSYLPYYNLAHLSLKMDGEEGVKSARQYYELGRTVGGPRDMKFERRLGVE